MRPYINVPESVLSTTPANLDEAKVFLQWCIDILGKAFHVDTSFEDYINGSIGKQYDYSFSPDHIDRLNENMESCYGVCTELCIDIYELVNDMIANC